VDFQLSASATALSVAQEIACALDQSSTLSESLVALGGPRLATVIAGPAGGVVVVVVERVAGRWSYSVTRFGDGGVSERATAPTPEHAVWAARLLLRGATRDAGRRPMDGPVGHCGQGARGASVTYITTVVRDRPPSGMSTRSSAAGRPDG
jgi:hypothetical protein